MLSWWTRTVVLLHLLLGGVCQEGGGCLRTADLLSCSGLGLDQLPAGIPVSAVTLDLSHNRLGRLSRGSFPGLSHLEALNLNHNQLVLVQPGTFQNASGPRLRHLDLSSNQLQVLQRHLLVELPGLEELLLFNNRIVQVESGALAAPPRLRKVYLSHNRITTFPFSTLPALSLLDLSSNRLSQLPVEDVSVLPLSTQRGLHLHSNPLRCDCSTLQLFHSWKRLGFASVSDHLQQHVCLLHGVHGAAVHFLQHQRYLDRCNANSPAALAQNRSVSVQAGHVLLLHCSPALPGRNVTVVWGTPAHEDVVPPGNGGSLKVYANGSLEITAARVEDSGLYWCMALEPPQHRNQTQEVNVTVLGRGHAPQAFSTGFTTLLGCLVSLLLVLLYLYLTPCRCPALPSTGPAPSSQGHTQTSILSPAPPAHTEGQSLKVSSSKHVVFVEPIKEQNGRLSAGTDEQPRPLPSPTLTSCVSAPANPNQRTAFQRTPYPWQPTSQQH